MFLENPSSGDAQNERQSKSSGEQEHQKTQAGKPCVGIYKS